MTICLTCGQPTGPGHEDTETHKKFALYNERRDASEAGDRQWDNWLDAFERDNHL